mgnify:FL=1
MITIYHNPRCSKSREGLCELEQLNEPFEIRKYLEDTLTVDELKELLNKLKMKPLEIVRVKESLWIKEYKGKTFSDNQLIAILIENPKLMERPIIVKNNKAIIARPKENINKIL